MFTIIKCTKSGGYVVMHVPRDPMSSQPDALGVFNNAAGEPDTITCVLYDADGDMMQAYANPADFAKDGMS